MAKSATVTRTVGTPSPTFSGSTLKDFMPQITEAISEIRMGMGDLVPEVTTNGEDGLHQVINWDISGGAQVQYIDNTNIPDIMLEQDSRIIDMHQVEVKFDRNSVQKLLERQKKRLPLTEDVIKSILRFGIEVKLQDIFLYGMEGDVEGLLTLKKAQTFTKPLTTIVEIKKALLEARRAILAAGAKANGMFTCLVPLEYEDKLKDYVTDAIDESLEEYLLKKYNIFIRFNQEHDKIVMFQDTFSNIYFHRDENIEFEERKDYHSTGVRYFALLTLCGLVCKVPQQVSYIEKASS